MTPATPAVPEGHQLKVKIWGARGSFPAPWTPAIAERHLRDNFHRFFDQNHSGREEIETFLAKLPRHALSGYGGNTPCIEVSTASQQVIIDGGSGIRMLGYQLMSGACGKGAGEVHIVFTHFHWDHILGLLFFTPLFIPGNRIHVYAVEPDLEEVFRTLFKKPYFPVPLEKLGATIEYHQLAPREAFVLGDLTLTPYQLDHPDPCWGYRFEKGGKVFSHCVDTECTRVSREQLGPDLPLYQGVDLMIFDAQYTLMETIEKVDWGHAAASLGLDIAMREGVRRIVFMHHDPASSDEKVAAAEAQARRYYEATLKAVKDKGLELQPVDWCFAHEGMVFEL